jgi:hypothetical protein
MRLLFQILFFTLVFSLSLVGIFFIWHDIRDAEIEQQARADLHRLGTLSVQVFRFTDDPDEKEFWRALGGAAPLRDPWGTPYHLNAGHQSAEWISAGPDKRFGTEDDLSLKVPTGRAIPEPVKPNPPSNTTTAK